jgi:flagellar hook-length control protein FliK
MTAAVASPPISVPDIGSGTAAKAAAAPEQGDSFGAMLSQLDAAADPNAASAPACDGEKSPAPQIHGTAFADVTALVAAMTNPMPLIAQAETPLPPKQDVATPPAPEPAPQPVPQFANDTPPTKSDATPQQPAAPTPSAGDSTQTPAAADSPIAIPAPIVATDDSSSDAAPANASTQSTPAAKPAAPRSKDDKPARAASDTDASAPVEVAALLEASPPVTAQALAVPAAAQPTPQTAPQQTPAPAASGNATPQPAAIAAAAPAAPVDAQANTPAPNKAGNPKTATAADAKVNTAKTGNGRDTRSTPTADSAPVTTSDANDRPVRTAEPAEHGAKNEAQPLAASLPQSNPVPAASSHGTSDLTASAISSASQAAQPQSTDVNTPVKLSFAAPVTADAPSFDALALRIAARSADGENNFSIRLDPPELGRIEVNLNVNSDGHAQAALTADKPQTLELMQKDASTLERALKDAGLNLAGGMTFSLKGDGKSQAWRDTQNGSRGRSLSIAAVDAASANAAITTSAALAAKAYGLPVALLDIRV